MELRVSNVFIASFILLGASILVSACATNLPQITPEEIPLPVLRARPTSDVEKELMEAEPIEGFQIEDQKLLGLEPKATEKLFGVASFVRWEGNATIRQYKSNACILDIVFYEEFSGAPFRVTHFESRSQSGEGIEIKNCIEGFFKKGKIPSFLLKKG